MKLKRKWARTVDVLLILAVIFALATMAGQAMNWLIFCEVCCLGCFVAAGTVQRKCLRCLHCGKASARPQWRAGKTLYCPHCGKAFLYDDEELPEDAAETAEEASAK